MTIDNTAPAFPYKQPSPDTIPIGTGPPTYEELIVHYPAKFTWEQLKVFTNSGDLGLLKRHKQLQLRYNDWAKGIKAQHGDLVTYLNHYRLQWGKPDALSLLPTALKREDQMLPSSQNAPNREYFCVDTPAEDISIIQNDWPYSVPPEIEHSLIWTRVPINHPSNVHPSISARVAQDGLWGFTGNTSPPPSPSLLSNCLPALAEWGITKDKMIVSQKGTKEEEELIRKAGSKIDEFVRQRWKEEEWETAWFVNPPRLQSIPGLAHIHVFARYKNTKSV